MDKLTREAILLRRHQAQMSIDFADEHSPGRITVALLKQDIALCDLALQALSLESVREEALEVDQTEFGAQGNCQSACLAMLLGIPLAEIPNFAQIAFKADDNAADKAQQDWLRERGWGLVTIVKWQSLPWPPKHGFYIAGGTSKRGNRHGVVFKDGELWHDPHPDRTGIESVDDVDILYPLAPFAIRALQSAVRVAEGGQVREALSNLVSLLLQTMEPIGPMRDRKDYPPELQTAINVLRSSPESPAKEQPGDSLHTSTNYCVA